MKALAEALVAFQAELVTVGKSATNPFFKSSYAPLDAIMKAAQPILTKHGLAVAQFPSHVDGRPALRTVIVHTSGETLEDTSPLSLVKDDPQSQGSAITYLRRYAYCGALGIVIDEDDDGNTATRPPVAEAHPITTTGPATSRQIAKIQEQMRQAGFEEREKILGHLTSMVGRTIESSKDLTASEASRVIRELTP